MGGGSSSGLINVAIDFAVTNNRVVAFAAGNESGPVSYPANLSTSKVIIAVSATNEWDQFKTTTSSDGENWGSNFGPEINVSAPGVHMWTTDISGAGGYAGGDYIGAFNGTSSSTPLVAGTAALLLSQNPGWTPTQVRNRLQSTADDKGAAGFDIRFGHGRINACKVLGGICDPPPNNCSNMASVNPYQPTGRNIGQNLVNIVLLFSTVLLFLSYLIIRRVKRRVV